MSKNEEVIELLEKAEIELHKIDIWSVYIKSCSDIHCKLLALLRSEPEQDEKPDECTSLRKQLADAQKEIERLRQQVSIGDRF